MLIAGHGRATAQPTAMPPSTRGGGWYLNLIFSILIRSLLQTAVPAPSDLTSGHYRLTATASGNVEMLQALLICTCVRICLRRGRDGHAGTR